MNIRCAFSALHLSLTYGGQLGFVIFLEILIKFLRPEIVDEGNRVKVIPTEDVADIYDFVIIGAGSAGSVIANRLTELSNTTVLLLEAGGDGPIISDVPALPRVLIGTDREWQYKTEPSTKYCLGMKNQQCDWRTGKALGGSSMHNGLVYMRGNRGDYDHWKDLGNTGWGYDDVLEYFKKSEDIRVPELKESPYHGNGGHLTVEEFRHVPRITEYFLDVGREIGYDIVDYNGATQAGFSTSYGTLRDGLRCSTNKAFLQSASHRKNFYVSTYSMAEKILINKTTKTAYGVQFRREGKKFIVHAKKEVILSAGAMRSPQLLMLSGIGPKKHLEDIGIPVILDSPGVGQNLQDHVVIKGLVYAIDVPSKKPTCDSTGCKSCGTVCSSGADQFLKEKNGPLYQCPVDSALAFVYTKYADPSLKQPDMEVAFDGTAENARAGFPKNCRKESKNDLLLTLPKDTTEQVTYALSPTLLRPKSRGYIKLRDADPDSYPIIVANYFDDPHDLEVLIEGAKIGHNFSQTSTMKKLNARPNFESIAECTQFAFGSDDYWRCHARYTTNTGYHPSCSCKMGPADDAMAVVDPRLRVYGLKGLRVADASVMPTIVSANINAPTIMIAEKAADFVKEDHDLRTNEES